MSWSTVMSRDCHASVFVRSVGVGGVSIASSIPRKLCVDMANEMFLYGKEGICTTAWKVFPGQAGIVSPSRPIFFRPEQAIFLSRHAFRPQWLSAAMGSLRFGCIPPALNQALRLVIKDVMGRIGPGATPHLLHNWQLKQRLRLTFNITT